MYAGHYTYYLKMWSLYNFGFFRGHSEMKKMFIFFVFKVLLRDVNDA